MTDDLEGFTQWQDEIETRVGTLEVTQEAEARARASMDEDIKNLTVQFKVQKDLLQALSNTQSEHGEMLRDHGQRLVRLEAGQARLEAGQARLEAGLATVHAGVQTIIGLLDRETGQTAE